MAYALSIPTQGPFNIRMAKEEVGYQPRYKIEEGIKDFICWIESTRTFKKAEARFV
jgi:nucleoside-diphosphate-sugar epimerase